MNAKNGWADLYEEVCMELGPGLHDSDKRHLRNIFKKAWDRKQKYRKRDEAPQVETPLHI